MNCYHPLLSVLEQLRLWMCMLHGHFVIRARKFHGHSRATSTLSTWPSQSANAATRYFSYHFCGCLLMGNTTNRTTSRLRCMRMSMHDACTNAPYLVGGATVREVHTATKLTDTTTVTQYYLYQHNARKIWDIQRSKQPIQQKVTILLSSRGGP